jgi:hypothetical protein
MILFGELPIGTEFTVAADTFNTACVKDSNHSSYGDRYGTYRQVSLDGQARPPYIIEMDCEVKVTKFPWQVVDSVAAIQRMIHVPEGIGKA